MNDRFRLLRYARRYTFHIVASVILMAAVGAAHGLFVLLIKPVVDRVLDPHSAEAPVALFTDPVFHHVFYLNDIVPSAIHNVWRMVAFCMLMVFLTKGICDYLANYLINYAGVSAVTDLRNAVFDKVLKQGAQFFEATSTGRLMSSIMSDIDKIQVALSHILADLLRQTFTLLGLLFVIMHEDWKLAFVSLTVLPFVLVPTARIGLRIRRVSRRTQDNTAELNQILQETLSGHQVVKAFGSEAYESRRFQEAARRLRRSNLRYVRLQAIASPLIELFGVITIVCLLTYARTEILYQRMTPGAFFSFVIALLMMYEPVKRLTGIHNIFEQAIGASQKVFEYMDHVEEIRDKPAAVPLRAFGHGVLFDAVSFRYPGTSNGFALESVSMEVKAGEVVALVGPSGAGKTTLVNLVPRFYDPTGGVVSIDGHAVGDLQLASLRSQIGIVAQDTFLFNDTVANNIAYGQPKAAREAIRRAAENALAHEFIEALPEGYDTVIGERGVKLSGGQRQRIAIARALLKDAPILILDEATSHLDTESEMLVQHALANLMEHRTVIVIAHRLSTIRRADKIVVLDRGSIRETGTHEELVNQGGIYQRLHELQFLDAVAPCDRFMSRSMTGFARVRRSLPEGELVLSIKSVNHRGLDMHFHLPVEFDPFENSIRGAIKKQVARGHLQVHLTFNRTDLATDSNLNRPLLEAWLSAFHEAAKRYKLEDNPDLNSAFRIPGMIQTNVTADPDPELEKTLVELTEEAVRALEKFREREGTAIAAEMLERAKTIVDLTGRMEKIRSKATAAFQKRLKERLADLLRGASLEPQRLAQEAALLADRSDISEELIRLRTHAAQLEKLLNATGEVGKRLDFLLQEMNREANTILSKTGGLGDLGLTITDLALEAKSEIDKIREQSLNLE